MSFSVVVVGDRGRVGVGYGKAVASPPIEKAQKAEEEHLQDHQPWRHTAAPGDRDSVLRRFP